MRVLVIGKGGREHALCWRLNQSPTVWGLFCAPGSPGINSLAQPVPIEPTDAQALASFAGENKIDLTVVGPEDPLAAGIVDVFEHAGLKIFGPSKAAAQLEASKAFARDVLRSAGVPIPEGAAFDDAEAARGYVRAHGGNVVVKADGLALGKGVVVCDDVDGALCAIGEAMERRVFGDAGRRVVIEERLRGEELSFFALCDGKGAVAIGSAQDHKQILDGDLGPNTGGMGAYSPAPQFALELDARIMREVVAPVIGVMADRGMPFRGVLFVGLMIDGDRFSVLEFNVRFGDPECEALMMRFESDLAAAMMAAVEQKLSAPLVKLSPRSAVSVVLASGGYPGPYQKGLPIKGLEKVEGAEGGETKVGWALDRIRVKAFHAGTALADGGLVTNGGRVMVISTLADTLAAALKAAYQAADMIEFDGKHLRRDIGRKALERGRS